MVDGDDGGEDEGHVAEDEVRRRDRRALLDQMTGDAEEMGLYDDPPPDYRAALKAARHRRGRSSSSPE
jgi:hypothetical protein